MSNTRTKRPSCPPPILDTIPASMKAERRWCCWRYEWKRKEKKWSKVPIDTSTNDWLKWGDRSTWLSFDDAATAFQRGGYSGVGFFLGDDWCGIDFDDHLDPITKEPDEYATSFLTRLNSRSDISPSGEGVKVIVRATITKSFVDHSAGIEIYGSGRFFTVTGHRLEQYPADVEHRQEELTKVLSELSPQPEKKTTPKPPHHPDGQSDRETATAALSALSSTRCDGYFDWLKVGQALHSVDTSLLPEWDSWSRGSAKYAEGVCAAKWNTFRSDRGGVSIGSLCRWADEDSPGWGQADQKHEGGNKNWNADAGDDPPPWATGPYANEEGGKVKPDAKHIDAMREARQLITERATHCEGGEELQKLHSFRSSWWWWTGTHYREEADSDIEAKTIHFLDSRFRCLTKTATANCVACLRAETNVNSHREMPCWLDDTKAGNWLAMRNGILDLTALLKGEANVLRPQSPRFFSANYLPYDFDPTANCPKWLAFLDRNLEGDQERIAILQEFYGYCLTPGLSAHKFLFHEGEGANGKSVACGALTAMLGTSNVSSVPLESFGERFSLYPTLGKMANIAAEVGEIDRVAEGILKAYTTGDAIQFDRKHRDPITARPTAKLVFASNNRPRFNDKSGGLWRRMILMPWRITIPEGERIRGMDSPQWWQEQAELPGVLLWAIAGLWRLERQGGFTKSAVCEAALAEYRAESNPSRLFLEERYDFDPESWTVCEDVYRPYVEWTRSNGFLPLSASSFGHEVRRAFPLIERRKKLIGAERPMCYFGLATRR